MFSGDLEEWSLSHTLFSCDYDEYLNVGFSSEDRTKSKAALDIRLSDKTIYVALWRILNKTNMYQLAMDPPNL